MEATERKIEVLFEELFEEIMIFISKDDYKKEINRAHDIFVKGLSEDLIELGFNEWLIFDYHLKSGKTFIEIFSSQNDLSDYKKELLKAMENSIFSAFKVMSNNKNKFLKDIFTKIDYKINMEEKIDENLIVSRIIKFNNINYIFNIYQEWKEDTEASIKKSILEKYNQYCSKYNNISIDDFIKENTIALYKYLMIYKDLEMKSVFQDEEFFVYQAKYHISSYKKFMKLINESDKVIFQTDEFKNDIYELYSEGIVLSEIELINEKIILECRSKDELDKAMIEIKNIFGDVLIKLTEEVLNVEDLI